MTSTLAKEFGVKLPKPEKEEKVKKPSISPFDFVNDIYYGKEHLMVDEWSENQYNPYIVNMTLSFGVDTILPANEMNQRPSLDKKMQYDYLMAVVRKKKRYNKWEKREKQNKNIDIIKQYFGFSSERAREASLILSDSQIEEMKRQLQTGGAK